MDNVESNTESQQLRPGDIVTFDSSAAAFTVGWMFGIILEEYPLIDRPINSGHFKVLTTLGVKVVNGCFMKSVHETR